MGDWYERIRVDAIVGHFAPFSRHGTKEAEGSEGTKESDKEERLPFAQQEGQQLLYRGRDANNVEAAKLAKVEHKGTRYAAWRGYAAAVWWRARTTRGARACGRMGKVVEAVGRWRIAAGRR